MRAVIKPSKAKGNITAPPSKSMAHRMLICAGLSEKESVIENIEESQDILATLDCLEVLGAEYIYENNTVTIKGLPYDRFNHYAILPCRECGSTLRFFIPICLLKGKAFSLNGSERLLKRPLDVYEKLCDERGMIFSNNGICITVRGPLQAGEFTLDGGVSSQFISGLLFALPLLPGDSRINLTGKIESRSYINLTVSALKQFGVEVSWEDDRTLFIKGGQKYDSLNSKVEGDYSNAAFLDAFNLLDGEVKVEGLDDDSLQGDRVYKEHLEALKNSTPTISLADCPDLGPILFALAAALNGATFTDTERLKIKESDRVAAMAEELAKFGVEVTTDENTVTIKGGELKTPKETLSGHNDHRIVMSMAVLASVTGGEITEAEAVRKSFPDFFERIKEIGIDAITTEE